jgi:hypothetical protein
MQSLPEPKTVGGGVAMAAFGACVWWLERQQVGRLLPVRFWQRCGKSGHWPRAEGNGS